MRQRIERINAVKKAHDEKYKKMCQKMTGTFDRPSTAIPVSAKASANQKSEKQISQSEPVNHMLIIGAVAAAGLAVVAAVYVLSKK